VYEEMEVTHMWRWTEESRNGVDFKYCSHKLGENVRVLYPFRISVCRT